MDRLNHNIRIRGEIVENLFYIVLDARQYNNNLYLAFNDNNNVELYNILGHGGYRRSNYIIVKYDMMLEGNLLAYGIRHKVMNNNRYIYVWIPSRIYNNIFDMG